MWRACCAPTTAEKRRRRREVDANDVAAKPYYRIISESCFVPPPHTTCCLCIMPRGSAEGGASRVMHAPVPRCPGPYLCLRSSDGVAGEAVGMS